MKRFTLRLLPSLIYVLLWTIAAALQVGNDPEPISAIAPVQIFLAFAVAVALGVWAGLAFK